MTVRPARAADLGAILALLREAQGDAEDVAPEQFVVAEAEGRVVACGRLRRYGDVVEVASIAVAAACRRNGVGSAVVRALMAAAAPPLYLVCATHNLSYFARFGFREVPPAEAPEALRAKYAFCSSVEGSAHVMRWG